MGRNGSSQRKVEDKTSSTDTRRARARERRARERRRRLRKRELSRKVRMGAGGDQTTMVTIKVNHGERSGPEDLDGTYKVEVSPEDSIRALKERIGSHQQESYRCRAHPAQLRSERETHWEKVLQGPFD